MGRLIISLLLMKLQKNSAELRISVIELDLPFFAIINSSIIKKIANLTRRKRIDLLSIVYIERKLLKGELFQLSSLSLLLLIRLLFISSLNIYRIASSQIPRYLTLNSTLIRSYFTPASL